MRLHRLGSSCPRCRIAAIGQLAPRIVVIWGVHSMQPADVRQALNQALSSKLGADVVALPTSSCLEFARKYGEEALRTWLAEERRTFVQEFYDDPESEGRLEQLRAMVERIEDPKTLEHYRARLAAKDEERRILKALDFAATFFAAQLTGSEEGEGCRTYLADRKLREDASGPLAWAMRPTSGIRCSRRRKRPKSATEILEKAGLVKARERSKGFYDRFRGRVVFPIRSVAGDVIGFGGRILEQAEHAPKYLNTPGDSSLQEELCPLRALRVFRHDGAHGRGHPGGGVHGRASLAPGGNQQCRGLLWHGADERASHDAAPLCR